MKTLPDPSMAMSYGPLSCALAEGPPSPENPGAPFPAAVVMVPLGETFQTMLPLKSAMRRLPDPSTATPVGPSNCALVAGPPATVVMTPVVETLRTRWLPRSATKKLPDPSTATPYGTDNCALVAGPPSPEKPLLPLPATVVMTPVVETFLTRLL